MIPSTDITGLVLAGGRGSRMGGVDKGLQGFNGIPLAQHTLLRLQRQSAGPLAQVMINANRNLASYAALGVPVWPDTAPDFAGPLAGFMAGLVHCETPFLLTAPCDTPRLPLDLAARLASAMDVQNIDIAMVAAPETDDPGKVRLRAQPVFCLLRVELLGSLCAFIESGGRKVETWTAQHRRALVAFDAPGDDPRAFFNANTLAELQSLERC